MGRDREDICKIPENAIENKILKAKPKSQTSKEYVDT